MKKWREVLVSPDTSIISTISVINNSALQIALVTDHENHLLGTVTDGDIRRGILKGLSLDDPVEKIMCNNPTTAELNEKRESIFSKIKINKIHHVPILDKDRRVVGIEVVDDLIVWKLMDNWVVVMAGGLGTRMRPHTVETPKPMLEIGGKPILETLLEKLIGFGFHKFYFSVNYKASLIKKHFGNGGKWNVTVRYLNENKRLGTAGSLSLLPKLDYYPILVINGDIITNVNFRQLLKYHHEHEVPLTMAVREYNFELAYGIVQIDNYYYESIEEKPIKKFLINAGIYVLEEPALDYIPKNEFFDMPELLQKIKEKKKKVAVFPIREYWLDVGQKNDFEKAEKDFEELNNQ